MLKRRNSGGICAIPVGAGRVTLWMKLYLDGTDPEGTSRVKNRQSPGTKTLKLAGGELEIHEEGLVMITHQ